MKEIENLAESVKKKLNLEYDDKSVQYLEGFIERTKNRIKKEQWGGLVNSCGAFLGQCLILNYGGKWEKEENGAYCVCFDNNNKAYPFGKVSKQLTNGLEDSIYSFYEVIPIVFKLESKAKNKNGGGPKR